MIVSIISPLLSYKQNKLCYFLSLSRTNIVEIIHNTKYIYIKKVLYNVKVSIKWVFFHVHFH